MKTLFLNVFWILSLFAVTGVFHGEAAGTPVGHRHGLHGMLLYGSNGSYFLSHIPMFSAPHNEQLILKVSLSQNSKNIVENFGDRAFSLKPARAFSLDELALGKLTSFEAEVFEGSFESGGTTHLKSVEVNVRSVLVARSLPAKAKTSVKGFHYYLVQDATQSYLVNVISDEQPWQSIVKLKAINNSLGEGVWEVRSSTRLGSDHCSPVQVVDAGLWFRVNTGPELWCLNGPDFFEECP